MPIRVPLLVLIVVLSPLTAFNTAGNYLITAGHCATSVVSCIFLVDCFIADNRSITVRMLLQLFDYR